MLGLFLRFPSVSHWPEFSSTLRHISSRKQEIRSLGAGLALPKSGQDDLGRVTAPPWTSACNYRPWLKQPDHWLIDQNLPLRKSSSGRRYLCSLHSSLFRDNFPACVAPSHKPLVFPMVLLTVTSVLPPFSKSALIGRALCSVPLCSSASCRNPLLRWKISN